MTIYVAACALIDPDGRILISRRPKSKPHPLLWEFPGGKIEPGETPAQALSRELKEEIGIVVTVADKWITREYSYDQVDVKLHFFKVTKWAGQIQPKEEQRLSWNNPSSPHVSPVLPANELIFKAIRLPELYAITNAEEHPNNFIALVANKLQQGLRLIQIREKVIKKDLYVELAKKIIGMAAPYGARVMINSDTELAYTLGADGVHLNSKLLHSLPDKPANLIVSASCHNTADIEKAINKNLDFIVLSPVKETLSHPGLVGMGWNRFNTLLKKHNMPVYALGGMQRADLKKALDNGAVGIASQRSVWVD